MKYFAILLTAVILTACSSTPKYPHYSVSDAAKTSITSQSGLRSTLNFKVEGVGHLKGNKEWYLNALHNYKLPSNVTVVIKEELTPQLSEKFNIKSLNELKSKEVEVYGLVKREKIYLYKKGRSTGKFYYQNHIQLTDIEQIKLLN
jgi:hypothetical protein